MFLLADEENEFHKKQKLCCISERILEVVIEVL